MPSRTGLLSRAVLLAEYPDRLDQWAAVECNALEQRRDILGQGLVWRRHRSAEALERKPAIEQLRIGRSLLV